MSESPTVTLDELRSKTDRQLTTLINNRLDRGLTFARFLQSDETRRDWASTDYFHTCAEQAMEEAAAWITLVNGDRARLEFKLAQLREIVRRTVPVRAQAAC